MLLWLRNHPQSGGTALDVLDSRRPDIRNLLLNCPNSDTELPYIDLVIELLADKISPPLDSLDTSYVQTGLNNGTLYYYIVTAINGVGESVASASVSSTPTAPAVIPSAPTGISATPGDSQVTIGWTAVDGATGYNIYWSTVPGVTTATGAEITGTSNPYIQTALTNGTPYYYIVTAVNSLGESAVSSQVSATPAVTLAFLAQASTVGQQTGLSLDAINYLLTPPSQITEGWATTSQMTPANIASTLGAVQRAVLNLLSVSTTLASPITSIGQTSITVASDTGFPAPNFYIYIGSEILLVTAVGGSGNAVWTVARGQQGTTPAASVPTGTSVTPTAGDLEDNAVVPAMAANAHSSTNSPLNSDVTQTMLEQLNAPGGAQSLLSTLLNPSLLAATGTITIGGSPTPGDTLQAVFSNGIAGPITVSYTLTTADSGSVNQTASDFAQVINASPAVVGSTAFLAPCTVSGAVITLGPLTPGASGSSLTSTNTTIPGASHVSVSPGATVVTTATITISESPTVGDGLQAVLNDGIGDIFTVSYTLTTADSGSANQTASDFAKAINASSAVVGPKAFLAPCTVSGAVITLVALTPGAPGLNISSTNTATPNVVLLSPGTTQTVGLPAFQEQFQAIQLFDKVALLVRGLKLINTELVWLLNSQNAAAYGGPDFNQLPITPGQSAVPLSQLLTMLLAIKLERLWTAARPAPLIQTLFEIIAGVQSGTLPNKPAAQAALATITGWPLADIESFDGALGLVFPGSYMTPAVYDALRTLEAMSVAVNVSGPVVSAVGTTLTLPITSGQNNLTVQSAIGFPAPNFYINIGAEILLVTGFGGADNTTWSVLRAQQGTTGAAAVIGTPVTFAFGAQVVSWGAVPADEVSAESMAASALGVLKAQQPGEEAWLALAPTLMNPIRQNQSTALQAWLIAQRDASGNLIYDGTDGLFNYFLIDTQMTSCQVTSRVVQAYIAVQIFVERCLMNLEAPTVVVDLFFGRSQPRQFQRHSAGRAMAPKLFQPVPAGRLAPRCALHEIDGHVLPRQPHRLGRQLIFHRVTRGAERSDLALRPRLRTSWPNADGCHAAVSRRRILRSA